MAGDSLWGITAQWLGADASAAQISATWPSIYQANRATIGGNPNVIRPGEVLTLSG